MSATTSVRTLLRPLPVRSRTPALGAKVVARAWVDAAFKKRLLKDTRAALSTCDIDIGTIAEFSTLGTTWRRITRVREAPAISDSLMYSRSRRLKTSPRMTRA